MVNNRKIYRRRLLEKVEDQETRHRELVDKPIEIKSSEGVTLFVSDEEKKRLAQEIKQRMEDEMW